MVKTAPAQTVDGYAEHLPEARKLCARIPDRGAKG